MAELILILLQCFLLYTLINHEEIKYRHGTNTTRHDADGNRVKIILFEFRVKLTVS